jgi:hypothetical protein
VGPAGEKCEKTKEVALAILAKLCETRLEESVVPDHTESRVPTRMMVEGGN